MGASGIGGRDPLGEAGSRLPRALFDPDATEDMTVTHRPRTPAGMRALIARLRARAMDPSLPKPTRARAKRSLARWRGRLARLMAPRVSAQALRYVCPWLTAGQARRLGRVIGPAFVRYEITSPGRAAAAVAQFAHESAGFRTTTEFASGAAYEGRRDLGNTHPGDGVRFKGRGYLQITGRANYQGVSRAFGHDFLAHPADLAKPRWAAMASCWWWHAHGCNQLADSGDFAALSARINGRHPANGLADRVALHARARQVADRLVPRGR
jgi:putative chitinase